MKTKDSLGHSVDQIYRTRFQSRRVRPLALCYFLLSLSKKVLIQVRKTHTYPWNGYFRLLLQMFFCEISDIDMY